VASAGTQNLLNKKLMIYMEYEHFGENNKNGRKTTIEVSNNIAFRRAF
jgi:hypothetical protein